MSGLDRLGALIAASVFFGVIFAMAIGWGLSFLEAKLVCRSGIYTHESPPPRVWRWKCELMGWDFEEKPE